MVGFLEYLENLSPGQVQALASAGSALSALGGAYVDPAQRGKDFRQALMEAPGLIQAAEQGALDQELSRQKIQTQKAKLGQQQSQAEATQGLLDFIAAGAAGPGGAAAQAASVPGAVSPALAPDAFAGAPAGGLTGAPALTGGLAGGQQLPPELLSRIASAYPELFAKQYLEQAFRAPTQPKRYPLGEGDVLVDPEGNILAEGRPKTEKPTTLIKNLKAAGIEPQSPEGQDLIRKNLTRAGTQVTIKEGEKKGAFFATRMRAASDRLYQLESTGFDPTTITELLRSLGGNWARSKEGQQYRAAAREWMAPVLRYESGAAIPEQEFETYYETYFPVPGDNEETIRQKAAARASLERAMLGAYGGVAQQLGMQTSAAPSGAATTAAASPTAASPAAPQPGAAPAAKQSDRNRLKRKYGLE